MCRAYSSDEDEQLPTEVVHAGLPEGADTFAWVTPTTSVYTAPFSQATDTATAHTGVDYIHNDPVVERIEVVAAAGGRVVYVRDGCPQSAIFTPNTSRRECGAGWGNQVVIAHGGGIYTRYGHLAPGVPVAVGQSVRISESIATMGTSGRAMLRHLHFELGTAASDPNACGPTTPFSQVYDPALLGI